MAKMTLDDLRKLRESKKTDLRKREAEGKDIQVIVGMGTCGIAAGAKETLDAFLKALDEKNLPTVEVLVPGMPTVIYGNVDPTVAKAIVVRHLIGHELLNKLILDRPAADIIASK